MNRTKIEIRTESYIRVNGEPVRFDNLPDDLKRRAATQIKADYLNALYRGKAVFTPENTYEGGQECENA